jgi:hypothetical protein
MARRATFGHLPVAQPDISSTLVSIAHEMQSQNDSNIMDAWKNGGEFQGQQATDDVVLAYWQKRMAKLDAKDPLYDTYKDQVMQLQYGIEQSKQDLLHVQGAIDDTQYAQFFLNWAQKVPPNSEFWRVLQKDAAQLIESAKQKSSAGAEASKTRSFNAFVADQNKTINVGSALTDAITQMSKDTGLGIDNNGDQILTLLSQDYQAHPDKYRALSDALSVADPGFAGDFSHDFVATWISNAEQGYSNVATRANADGYTSQYSSAAKGQSDMSAWGTNLKVWPVATAYDKAYTQFESVWKDANASEQDKYQAAQRFAGVCGTLAAQPGLETASAKMLQADQMRAMGYDAGDSPSFGSAMLGHTGITTDIQATVANADMGQQLMNQAPDQYVLASKDAKGQFDPTGQSPVGVVLKASLPADALAVAQPGLDGLAHAIYVEPRPVYVDDPNNPTGNPVAVGASVTYATGGKTTTLYGYQDGNGVQQWSQSSPWVDTATATVDSKGNLHLQLPTQTPDANAAAIDATLRKAGFADANVAGAIKDTPPNEAVSALYYNRDPLTTQVLGRVNVTYKDGTFSATQTSMTYGPAGLTDGTTKPLQLPVYGGVDTAEGLRQAAIAPSRLAVGSIPGVTFSTPAEASAATVAATSSGAQLAALYKDPAFQQEFVQQTMNSLGIVDPADPQIATKWSALTNTPDQAYRDYAAGKRTYSGPGGEKPGLTYPGSVPDLKYNGVNISMAGQLKVPSVPQIGVTTLDESRRTAVPLVAPVQSPSGGPMGVAGISQPPTPTVIPTPTLTTTPLTPALTPLSSSVPPTPAITQIRTVTQPGQSSQDVSVSSRPPLPKQPTRRTV